MQWLYNRDMQDESDIQTELDIARQIQSGEVDSPQRVGEMWLFKMRITGTGVAYRSNLDEYVYRAPENYLNDEFLARSNGLAVIWKHPKSNKLDSGEFENRVIGSVFVPYIEGDEVWCIAKVYSAAAAEMMISKQLSTSPSVIFSDANIGESIEIDPETTILIEGKAAILDHLAVCNVGVWDKNGVPAGIIIDNQEALEMAEKDEKDEKAVGDSEAGEVTEADLSLDEKIKELVGKAIDKHLSELKKPKEEEVAADSDDDKETPSMADSGDPDFDKNTEKAIGDSATIKSLMAEVAELKKLQPRQRSNDEFDQLARAQLKAEQHYLALGDSASACRPMDGESVAGYRKRMLRGLQKHSEKFKTQDISKVDDQLLDFVEEVIYADSQVAAMSPSAQGLPNGMPREVVTRDEYGRKTVNFVGGDPMKVFAPWAQMPRLLVGENKRVLAQQSRVH